jgi:hypothetical protein
MPGRQVVMQVRRSSPLPLKELWTKQSLVGSSGKRVVSQERCGMVAYRGRDECEEASGVCVVL